jgi:CheY-like chemotaxis protein
MEGVMNHVVLYSFETLHALLNRKPQNVIATSQGTSFVRLPAGDLNKIEIPQMKVLAEPHNLRQCLKALFNVDAFRHEDANWWGVKCLWDVHKVAKAGKFSEPYPKIVEDKLKTMNNAVAKFLYQPDLVGMLAYVERLKERFAQEIKKAATASEVIQLEAEIAKEEKQSVENEQQQTQSIIDEYVGYKRGLANTDPAYIKLLKDIAEYEELVKGNEQKISILDKSIENEKYHLEKFEALKRRSENIFREAKKLVMPEMSSVEECKILLIDDNAKNGWVDILRLMLPNSTVETLVPERGKTDIAELYERRNDDGTLSNNCIKHALAANPDVVMLDLRLFDETTKSISVDSISGIAILKKLRADFPGLPVLIITASNKIWSYDEVVKWGADAYWIKEGVDEQRDFQESVNNYLHLINTIDKLIGKEYKALRRLAEFWHELDNVVSPNYWWEHDIEWRAGDITKGNKIEISRLLKESIDATRNYLHHAFLGFGRGINMNGHAFFASGIINKLACVGENIHGISDNKSFKKVKAKMDERKDKRNKEVRKLRGKASHISYKNEITILSLIDGIDMTINYLKKAN